MYRAISFFLLLQHVAGFASWFTADYCSTPLEVGEIIMNHEAAMSSERSIEIYRGTQQLKTDDSFIPGEQLTVVLNGEDAGEMVFESNFGVFEYGGCEDHRSTLSTSTVNIPDNLAEPIEFWAGWAFSHNTVWISSKFVLLPPKELIPRDKKPDARQDFQDVKETQADASSSTNKHSEHEHEHTDPLKSKKSQDQKVFEQVHEQISHKYSASKQKIKHKELTEQSQLYQLMEGYLLIIGIVCFGAVIFIIYYYKKKIAAMLGAEDTNLMKSY